VSTFVFSAVMKHQDTPGTTFKRHEAIARGVLSEDDTLLREILFNPQTKPKVEMIRSELKQLIQIIDDRDEKPVQGGVGRRDGARTDSYQDERFHE
jgi:prephenate dehydrogenase